MEGRPFLTFLFVFLAWSCAAQIDPAKIEIARDTFGIPHIFAPTDPEVAYGLAWAHCEDDFEHIQMMMITSAARLGELNGKDGAISDYFVRFIKARELSETRYNTDLTEDYKKMLQAYADGVNSYAAKHPSEVKLKGIFPVTPQNIVAAYIVILTSMVGVPDALECVVKGKPDEYIFNASAGSNAIAMNPRITADSSTYLLINPHVPLEGSASWYEAHLCSGQGWNIYGALVPGMISPAMGCNRHLGWGITFNWPDYVDIYKMEINPENKNQYKFDGDWYDFEVRSIPLKAKKLKVKKEALWCIYGPAYRTEQGVFALRYNTMFNVKAAEEWYRMSKAYSYREFNQALTMQGIPLFNFVMASDQEDIFYIFNGSLPVRSPDFDWQKTVPGNTSKTFWNSFYTVSQLPQKFDPSCGYVYNTNNTPFHCTAPAENLHEMSFDKQSAFYWNRVNNRELRFNELMQGKTKISFEDLKKIKYDCAYPAKQGGIYKTFSPIYDLKESEHPDIADAIAKLKKWDFTGYADNREAALVTFTFDYLFRKKNAAYNELETGLDYKPELLIEAIRYAKKEMLTFYKSIDVPFGEVQRLMREDKSFAVYGLPECLKSLASDVTKDGHLRANNGDSFIMFAKYTKKNYSFETVVPYGESRRKGSPHLTDQMELYANQKTKPVTLEKTEVLRTACRVYHPQ
jgi:acyl-homoserine-lactone acylase